MQKRRQPTVCVVILNWNGKADTLDCLASVLELDYSNFSVVVVDNGSIDDSVRQIRAQFPHVLVIETGKNLGYAGGNNVGIRHAEKVGAEFVLLLNNDTVVDRQLIVALTEAAERFPAAGMLSPKIYYFAEPRRIWYAGCRWRADAMNLGIRGWQQIDDGVSYEATEETGTAIGCALLARMDVVIKIGMLAEKFYLMHEESDWCYRASEAGHPSVFVPAGRVWHKVSVSFGGTDSPLMAYFATRNRLLWGERHLPIRQWLRLCHYVIRQVFMPLGWSASNVLPAMRELRRRAADPAMRAKMLGVRDYFIRRFGDCPESVRRLADRHRSASANMPPGIKTPAD